MKRLISPIFLLLCWVSTHGATFPYITFTGNTNRLSYSNGALTWPTNATLAGVASAFGAELGDGAVGQNTYDYSSLIIDKTFTNTPDLTDFSFFNGIGGTVIVKPTSSYNQPPGFSMDVQGILIDTHVADHGLTNYWGDVAGAVFWANNDSDAPLLSMDGLVANSYNNGTNTCINQYGIYTGANGGAALIQNMIGVNVGYLDGSKVGNKYGLRIPDITGATNDNMAIKTGAGLVSFGGELIVDNGTLTGASSPVLKLSQTWNNSGTNYTGLLLNITNTASGSSSKILDLQVGSTSMLNLSKAGLLTITGYGSGSLGGIDTASSDLRLLSSGNMVARANSGQFSIATQLAIGSDPSSPEVFLVDDAAATLQLGKDAATTTPQFLKSHDGTGTDKDGASLTVEGGQSTGTGRGGSYITRTSLTSTTGSSANSYSTRSYQSAKYVNLTESSATLFCNIALATNTIAGAVLHCTVYANDGTDFQALTSSVNVGAVNKAGTVTASLTQVDGTTAASSGTLTCTYTAVANGNGVDLKANAVSSLTQTVLRCKWSIVTLNSDDVGTVTAQ